MAGRRPEKALAAAFIKTVKEPGKYFDGHGLYLKVEPNGARFWVQRIAIRGSGRNSAWAVHPWSL